MSLSVSRRGWRRDGRPWFPLSGEYHYARSPRHRWRDELVKMKAAGLDVVATYVLWNHHEPAPDEWRWNGDEDLRAFVEECARAGLLVWLRIGPHCNAEATNGGLPDFALPGSRSDDPDYLARVERYWARLGQEVDGLLFADGGPVIAVQLENEFDEGDPAHIATLHALARRCGLDAPFFSVTANTRFDRSSPVLPLLGGYAYRGWEPGGGSEAVSGYSFGTDEWQATTDLGRIYYAAEEYPRGYIEMGTGSPMRGCDRFLVDPDDVVAQAHDALGRGASMLGYYMFHGGTQQPGLHGDWSLSYDFQAPIGEFGMLRPSWSRYRRLHSLIKAFTPELDAAGVVRDPHARHDPVDTSRLRHIGRFDERGSGFWFVNNRQRNVEMPQRDDVQTEVVTKSDALRVPDRPMSVPPGAFAAFPVRLLVGEAQILWATLQPLTRMQIDGVDTVVLWRPSWSTGELATRDAVEIDDGHDVVRRDAGEGITVRSSPGPWSARIGGGRVVVVDEADSLAASPLRFGGADRLVFSRDGDLVDQDSLTWLASPKTELVVDVIPGDLVAPGGQWTKGGTSPIPGAARWVTTVPPATVEPPDLVGIGGERWLFDLDDHSFDGVAEAQLIVDYVGASASLRADDEIIAEDLFHGEPWVIDLAHVVKRHPGRLMLHIEPWDDGIRGVERPDGPDGLRRGDFRPLVRVGWETREG